MGDVITPKKRGLPVVVDFFKEIYRIWISERPMQLAAALAYFGLFSFAPVIYVAFTIAGLFFRKADILQSFMSRLGSALGPELVQAIVQELVQDPHRMQSIGSLIGTRSLGIWMYSLSGYGSLPTRYGLTLLMRSKNAIPRRRMRGSSERSMRLIMGTSALDRFSLKSWRARTRTGPGVQALRM